MRDYYLSFYIVIEQHRDDCWYIVIGPRIRKVR